MKYTEENHDKINARLLDEWIKRSQSPLIKKLGLGCFIYNTMTDGTTSSGMYYKHDMLPKYFPTEVATGLQGMIEAVCHPEEVVAAVIFEDKVASARLGHYV